MISETEKRIEDEKKALLAKKQAAENESRMIQEKLVGVSKDAKQIVDSSNKKYQPTNNTFIY